MEGETTAEEFKVGQRWKLNPFRLYAILNKFASKQENNGSNAPISYPNGIRVTAKDGILVLGEIGETSEGTKVYGKRGRIIALPQNPRLMYLEEFEYSDYQKGNSPKLQDILKEFII